MATEHAPRLFVSYARRDAVRVAPYVDRLKAAGFFVWIDHHEVLSGQRFSAEIESAIRGSAAVLFFASAQANSSRWVADEVAFALQQNVAVLPLILEPAEFPPGLSVQLGRYHHLDLFEGSLDERTTQIIRAISSIGTAPELRSSSPQLPWIHLPERKWRPDRSPPAALLRADHGVVPFHGRRAEIDDLCAWVERDLTSAVRVYTGPGGMGKTRLLLHACALWRDRGYTAGFVDVASAARLAAGDWLRVLEDRQRVLVVIDYAKTNLETAEALLTAAHRLEHGRVRIVLLERSAGEWWERLRERRDGAGELACGPASSKHRLGPLVTTAEERRDSYLRALERFEALLGKTAANGPGELDFSDASFERVLLLHIAAFASIEHATLKTEGGILDYLLLRERRHWRESAERAGLSPLLLRGLSQTMAVVTLRGGIATPQEARRLIAEIPAFREESVNVHAAVTTLLHEIYPGEQWIEPLMPDVLGEHLIDGECSVEGVSDLLLDLAFGKRSDEK